MIQKYKFAIIVKIFIDKSYKIEFIGVEVNASNITDPLTIRVEACKTALKIVKHRYPNKIMMVITSMRESEIEECLEEACHILYNHKIPKYRYKPNDW